MARGDSISLGPLFEGHHKLLERWHLLLDVMYNIMSTYPLYVYDDELKPLLRISQRPLELMHYLKRLDMS